jgi:eukaryotic-like serine/threonine-protein kinase
MRDSLDRLASALVERYVIERVVGAGGMATVYLARDVRHDRPVALKVLNPELGAVLGAERFLAEIKTTANLQHPHLLPLFDSGQADGLLYYVMPYVEGESLRRRLDRERQLPIDESVHIATAVAGALEYAHAHGVIHRDLKPENILIHAGQPVIADFGIALAVSNAGGARITQTGLSLGTPQYMSPEQATGDRTIDGRADIYSLGAVTHEMLVGDPPHVASTAQAIIAKVLTEQPADVRTLRPSVPEHVALAVGKALQKLPADRFATPREFAEALRGVGHLVGAPASRTTPELARDRQRVGWRASLFRWAPWAIAALAVSALAAVSLRREATPVSARFPVELPDSVRLQSSLGQSIALSPDGSTLVLAAQIGPAQTVLVRRLDDPEPRALPGVTSLAVMDVSPDNRWILLGSPALVRKVPVTGGEPTKVADRGSGGVLAAAASWSSKQEVVYSDGISLWRVSEDGGTPALVARPDSARGYIGYSWPDALPGGNAALITIWKGMNLGRAELGVMTLPEGRVTELGIVGTNPRYVSGGFVIFGRANGTIYAAPLSLRTLRVTAEPMPVLEGVSVKPNGGVELTVADNGTLAYITGEPSKSRLRAVTRDGLVVRAIGTEVQPFEYPRVSPDGRRVAVTISPMGGQDIWTYDLVSQALTPLTRDGGSQRAEWSLDGRQLVYIGREGASNVVRQQVWDGRGTSEVFAKPRNNVLEVALGPLHTYAAFRVGSGATQRDIWIASLDSLDKPRPFVATSADEWLPAVSPNGRLLAYVTTESGRAEVYVRPLAIESGRIQVSAGGGVEPVWSKNGKELFYRGTAHIIAAAISESPELALQKRDTLFPDVYLRSANRPMYDVFPNGREFLMLQEESRRPKLYVVVNWTEELRRKLRSR